MFGVKDFAAVVQVPTAQIKNLPSKESDQEIGEYKVI